MSFAASRVVKAGLGAAVGLFVISIGHRPARAESHVTECYRIKSEDSPAAIENPSSRADVWCYRKLQNPQGSTLIYNIDEKGKATPELSVILGADASITHVSLLSGEQTVHRLVSRGRSEPSFNPLGVPLTPPKGAERVPASITPSSLESSDKALEILTTRKINFQDVALTSEGTFSASVTQTNMPWRGYWFPHSSGRLHTGGDSPLAKFDRFVKARTGVNPGAQAWERTHHEYTGVNWAGHCNGWAAASTLRKEPTESWTDPISGVTFQPNDIKGILIERDYCPKMLFFGRRFNGRGNPRDITADLFHKTLTYYIGQLGKPVQVDIMSSPPVENRVISGYQMKVENIDTLKYRVTLTAKVHGYDTGVTKELGAALSQERVYRYELTTDELGNILKGRWLSANPDFLWLPIAPASCSDGNPAVTETWVQTLEKPLDLPWK